MLTQVQIDRNNFSYALALQRELFPEFSAEVNYRESVEKITTNRYYLLYDGGTCVGISGIYEYEADPTSAWLGWFGILPAFRRRGYGSAAIRLFEEEARSRGYTHTRLYTDKYDNEAAVAFYEANGYTSEEYLNAEDAVIKQFPILIFSKRLSCGEVRKWNHKFIDMTGQIAKQM